MHLPSAITKQSEIQAAIDQVERSLSPDVVRIRYEIGEDWSGQWALFFRIVLSDDAARRRLREVAGKVVWGLGSASGFPRHGCFPRITTLEAFRNKKPYRNRLGPKCWPTTCLKMPGISRQRVMRSNGPHVCAALFPPPTMPSFICR